MSGNTFGRLFRVTTFGESQGPAVGAVVDGVPPRLPLRREDIQKDLDRRRPGQSDLASPRREADRVEILSGVFEDLTTGTPIALLLRNLEADASDYERFKDSFRPGHADYTYQAKYGIRDWRGGGRSSGRETAARVAAGAVARRLLEGHGIRIVGYTLSIADVRAEKRDYGAIEANPVRSPDPEAAEAMAARIRAAREKGDSVGGVVEVRVLGVPSGLGEPVFDKLEARLAAAVMSIGGVRGFELGEGFACSRMTGSQFNDPFMVEQGRVRTSSNHAGGILGGISTGEEIVLRAAVRPTPSIARPQRTVTMEGKETVIQIGGRHDPCIVPRLVPVAEAMVALALADFLLIQESRLSVRTVEK